LKLTIADLNKTYLVESIDKKDKNAFKKICSLGILPGVEVAIIQKTPSIVFQVYNGIFAIDSYLGDKINVKLYRSQS